jgi:fructose-bisphosphate aldolase class II
MPLVAARTIYERAKAAGYAVGGFDAEHLDMVKAIVEAAEETRSPVIVFLWEEDIKAVGEGYLEAIVKYAAEQASVPVAMMVDHGTTMAFCLRAAANGHSGVMIDGSHLPLEENIALSRQIADVCHMMGVMVEGEVGTVKRSFEQTGPYAEEAVYTSPDEAVEYVRRSGVDALAISIGTESGLYRDTPQLDFDRLRLIHERTAAYLIIHGGSGLPPDQVQRAVAGGIAGIRFATEMRLAFFETIESRRRELGHEHPDSRLILGPAREKAKALIKRRMAQMGCVGQACTDGLCSASHDVSGVAAQNATPHSRAASLTSTDMERIVETVTSQLRREMGRVY